MDQRHRVQRGVSDPKVRQVGFFAPNPNPDIPARSSPPLAGLPSNATSSSPVIIIPPPPPPAACNHAPSHLVVGSFDAASESLLGTSSPLPSPPSSAQGFVGDGEFSDESWLHRSNSAKVASSFPSGGFNLTAARTVAPPEGDSTPALVAANGSLDDSLAGKNEVSAVEVKSERTENSKPLKAKMTKSERRALQESQRAAKAAAKGEAHKPSAGAAPGGPGKAAKQPTQKKDMASAAPSTVALEGKGSDRLPEKERKKDVPAPRMQFDDKSRVGKAKRRVVVNQTEAINRVELFRHLPQYEHGSQLPDLESKFFQLGPMHPAVYKVGLQYLSGELTGGNARCIAMLQAFREAIKDYVTPPEKNLTRDLMTRVSSYVSFLNECRPLSVSMGNAIRFVKNRIAKMQITLSESEAKASICSDIDRFINEKIILADQVIVKHATTKIRDGDVLLTYGASCAVEMILLDAHEVGKKFRVIIVDSRPKLGGQRLLRRLVMKGLNCTYTHINAVSCIMHEVSKVLLGAASVLSNGTVYSRVGTASVAMVANSFRVPVLICCEAYKFHERVQLDSICFNELGDPDAVSKVSGRLDVDYLENWGNKENLQLLNLMYDVTPSDYVSVIVTDYGMIPPTSVPVIVREYRKEQLWM